jgi:hypothetical protein
MWHMSYYKMGWDLGADPFWVLGPRITVFFELGLDPFLNLGPGTWGTLRGACIASSKYR